NPQGNELLSVGYDGRACVWDVETLEPVKCLSAPGRNWGADWSSDGRWIAAGADRGTARIWDWTNPDAAPVAFASESELAMGVAFNADASELAIAPLQDGIQIHPIGASEPPVRRVGQGEFFSVEWSEDGRYIASGLDDGVVIVWTESGEEIVRMSNREAARGLAFSPDNRFLATGSDAGEARVWSIPSGQLVAELRGHKDDVDSIAWTPDGDRIVTGTDLGVLRVFAFDAIDTSQPLTSVLEDAKQRLLADQSRCISEEKWAELMPDEGLPDWCLSKQDRIDNLITEIAAAAPEELPPLIQSLRDLDEEMEIFEALEVAVSNLQITPQSPTVRKDEARRYIDLARSLGVAEQDQIAARIALLNFQIERTEEDSKEVEGLIALEALSRGTLPTGIELASSASALNVFAQATGAFVLPNDQSRVRSLSLFETGGMLAAAMESGRVQLWDYANRLALDSANSGLGAAAYQVAFDPSGTRIAIAFQDERFAIWPAPDDMWTLIAGVKIPRSVGWSQTGRYLATGGDDEVARVWDMENSGGPPSAVVFEGHTGGIRDLALSASGDFLLTGSNDATARLWDTASQRSLFTFPRDAGVNAVDYSPNDALLAIGGADDRVEVRDPNTGELLRVLEFASNVDDVAFSGDGRWLAVASSRASVWDVQTGERRLTLNGDQIASVTWAGDKLLTGSTHGKITQWSFDPDTLEGAVRQTISRCLSPEERARFGLPSQRPEWCVDISR
ncbi:MAG: WD40 repeat domain-containing protein, partial [Pseudomonadota bacterium]